LSAVPCQPDAPAADRLSSDVLELDVVMGGQVLRPSSAGQQRHHGGRARGCGRPVGALEQPGQLAFSSQVADLLEFDTRDDLGSLDLSNDVIGCDTR
jgi:hypothetical protein